MLKWSGHYCMESNAIHASNRFVDKYVKVVTCMLHSIFGKKGKKRLIVGLKVKTKGETYKSAVTKCQK